MNDTAPLRSIGIGYRGEMSKFKMQVPTWFLVVIALMMIGAIVLITMPLGKSALDNTINRPVAYFRFEGGDAPPRILAGIEINGKKIPVKELTDEQKKMIQKGHYNFGGWVGPNEKWGK